MVLNLIQSIKNDVITWRGKEYKTLMKEWGGVQNILNFQRTSNGQYRFLRNAQFEAIELYLYLRFVKGSPKIIDLYKEYYQNPRDFCKALEITHISEDTFDYINNNDDVLQNITKNQDKYKYHSLIETLNLDYPSYILALAMGSGKTHIISSIIAIEFAIAMQNENNSDFKFMQNALVFAPGLTILKNSLKKISTLPFEKILPPEMCKMFLANVKYIYAKDSVLTIDKGSKWNVIIANSEKLILKVDNKPNLFNQNQEAKQLASNNRLEAIKSLPNLGIFSDEAHHTYGNKIGDELKKVRETINHVHKNKELVCVINTTGTPYADKKMIKDVVFWYGLEDGIRDNILKNLNDGIVEYSDKDMKSQETVVGDIIKDFFGKYKQGYEKIAFYFKEEKHLEELKPYIEKAIFNAGLTSDIILKHTLKTKGVETEKEFFALDEPQSKKRVILLIGMGKEGWDCKTLFATALISEASGSNNYILQASTRCLRQIQNNIQNATIYLSSKNREILDKELQANYGIDSRKVAKQQQNIMLTQEIIVKKPNIPTFEIKIKTRSIKEDTAKPFVLELKLPNNKSDKITKFTSNLNDNKIINTGKLQDIYVDSKISLLLASNTIATNYHLSNLAVLKELQKLYPQNEMPENHLQEMFNQIDSSKKNYIETTDVITQIIAIIKTEQGFEKNEKGYYYHTLRYTKKPIFVFNKKNTKWGFHYEPYNFDSEPENGFFEKILNVINANADEIEDIYFTGGLTTPDKTDFHFEYKGTDGRYHKYYPDFLVKKKNGDIFIVEIKGQKTEDVETKQKAVEQIAKLNENKIKYCVLYTDSQSDKDYLKVVNFIKNDK